MKEKTNNRPIRTCVYTRKKAFKDEMIRLVINENGKYILDSNKKMQKRGIYIYPCEKVINIMSKNKKYDILDSDREKIIEIIKVGECVE